MSALIWYMQLRASRFCLWFAEIKCASQAVNTGLGGGGRASRDDTLTTLPLQLSSFIHTKLKSNLPVDDCYWGDNPVQVLRAVLRWLGTCSVCHCPSKNDTAPLHYFDEFWGYWLILQHIWGELYSVREKSTWGTESCNLQTTECLPGCISVAMKS